MFLNFYLLIFTIFLTLSKSEEITNTKHEADRMEIKRSTDEAIKLIKSRNFTAADNFISQFGSELLRLDLVVREMYTNDNSTFNVLMEYANNTNNADIIYHILDELWIIVIGEEKNHLNEFCQIYSMLNEKVINNPKLNSYDIEYATKDIIPNIIKKIKTQSVRQLKEELNNEKFYETLELVHAVNETLLDEVLIQLINQEYTDENFRNLLMKIWKIEWIAAKVVALKTLYWQLSKYTNNKGQLTLSIAYYFYKLKQSNDYSNLADDKKTDLEKCIDHLPSSLQHLYFTKRVCFNSFLRNRRYLATTSDYEDGHRQVDTVYGKDKMASGWISEVVDELEFRFKSIKHDDEYLYGGGGWWALTLPVYNIQNEADNDNLIWQVRLYSNQLAFISKKYKKPICIDFNDNVKLKEFASMTSRCGWLVRACD